MITPPSKIKLYYINQGICKRVTMTSVKYSDDINVRYTVYLEEIVCMFLSFPNRPHHIKA